MAEKIRLTEEQKAQNNENIEKIKALTAQIKEIVPNLHGKACKEAYENSVSNLETKNEKYVTKESFPVSDEEKEILRKLRAGEIAISDKAQDTDAGISTVSKENVEAESSGKKGRRH